MTFALAFSKTRGAAPMKVGRTSARLSVTLATSPSMAVGKPTCAATVSRSLPITWESGSHSSCRSPVSSMPKESTAAASYVQAAWVRRTPLGRPVVPEV